MSSATSINGVLSPEGGSDKKQKDPRGFPPAGETTADNGFHVWHFFVLLSLVAATIAVIMARQSTPQHLILISLTVGAAGLAAYAFYRTLAPLALTDPSSIAEPVGERLRADLDREKRLVLRSIKELEFDRAMGKLSPTDFDEMSARLRARAIRLMKQIEGGSYREIIERDLAARIGRSPSPSQPDAPTVPDRTSDAHAGLCVCGVKNDDDARFCKACGSKLDAA